MYMKLQKFIVSLLLTVPYIATAATEPGDTAIQKPNIIQRVIKYFDDSNKEKETKKFDFSIIGGPHYSSDRSFGIGLVAAGTYRRDLTDTITPPSNVSVYGDISVILFYKLGIEGNHVGRNDSWRIDYDVYFLSFPDKYWGIGYDMNRNNGNETKYKRYQTRFKADLTWRIAPQLYVGPQILFDYTNAHDTDRPEMWHQRMHTFSTGAGLAIQYDTRDHLTNPYRGWFLRLEQMFFPKFIFNRYAFSSTEFTAKWYKQIWKGGVIATQFHALFTYGNTPWGMMARLGGSDTMRGYYEGRYNDKCAFDTTVELRQHVWRRNGVVVWAGFGEVFPDFSRLTAKHILPNFGLGYRWEFKKRVNVRLDFGFGKGQSGFIFNINEAF